MICRIGQGLFAAFALFMISGELKKEDVKTVTVDWFGLALMVGAIASLQLILDLGSTRDWFASHLIQVAALSAGLTPYDPAVAACLAPLGLDPQSPAGVATAAMQVQAQASMMAFQDAFFLTGMAAFAMLPVVLSLQRPTKGAVAAPAH